MELYQQLKQQILKSNILKECSPKIYFIDTCMLKNDVRKLLFVYDN